ncbi:type IV pilus assembly protein PilM [Nocardioides sp. YIM 152315]|uniref:type IV pilus assembly protein PilM n=1 Tax=Nocardioides sp. YIM 152315 TaxID=3031760 RepID=UPI0023D9D902|nr:type IV pilus assembly protein PilM [Nocardioides sp. YIM 152315]MDF1603489.1 type IV pilus assembly protein PilM [Nocardioides sp. YIM 152315]
MSRTQIGLDVGGSGVRAAELAGGRRPQLRRFAQVPLRPGVVRAGTVGDPEALAGALRELWSRGRFSTKDVRLGVANGAVLVRQLDLDWMPPADFRKALRYQVQDVLPFSVDEANLDYHLVEDLEVAGVDGTPRRVARILLVAASREMIDGLVAAAERAGLRVCGVDLVPFAALRARHRLGPACDRPEALIDVGSDVIAVVVHTAGVPAYARIIPGVGGEAITKAIQDTYEWAWEDAERTKVFVGLPGHARLDDSQRSVLGPGRDGLDHAAQQVVAGTVDRLVSEIATTLDFYRDSADPAVAGIERIVLTGAASRLGGFDEHLTAALQVPVEHLDVRPGLRVPGRLRITEADAPALTVASGLGLGVPR